jgi:mono/diheme cytochrome c family protein
MLFRISATSTLAFSAILMSACGGGGGGTQSTASYEGPVTSTDVAGGEQLFNDICMSCHGGGAPALQGIGWEPARMRQQIREGEGRMPAINESRLDADGLEAVLAYMQTIGGVNGGSAEPADTTETTGDEAPVEGEEAAP